MQKTDDQWRLPLADADLGKLRLAKQRLEKEITGQRSKDYDEEFEERQALLTEACVAIDKAKTKEDVLQLYAIGVDAIRRDGYDGRTYAGMSIRNALSDLATDFDYTRWRYPEVYEPSTATASMRS